MKSQVARMSDSCHKYVWHDLSIWMTSRKHQRRGPETEEYAIPLPDVNMSCHKYDHTSRGFCKRTCSAKEQEVAIKWVISHMTESCNTYEEREWAIPSFDVRWYFHVCEMTFSYVWYGSSFVLLDAFTRVSHQLLVCGRGKACLDISRGPCHVPVSDSCGRGMVFS